MKAISPQRHGGTVKGNQFFGKPSKIRFLCCTSVPLWLAVLSPVFAQQGGQRPAAYLSFGVGGMQQAMGGAAAAVRNEPSCAYWNPAGLTGIKGIHFEDQYTLLSEGRFLNSLVLGANLGSGLQFGFASIAYSAGSDLELRMGPSLDPDDVVGSVEMAFLFSLAGRLDRDWSLGGTLKLFADSLGALTGIGLGEDLGLQWRMAKATTLGFTLQDPLSLISFSEGRTEFFPATLRAGLSHLEEDWAVRMNFDLEWSQDLGMRPRAGLEWRPWETLALRGGAWVGNLTGEGAGSPFVRFTGGVGLLVPAGDRGLLEFGYTMLPDGMLQNGFLHQVSLKGKFF